MTAIIIPIESKGSWFSEVPSNVGFLTCKVFLKNHRVPFHKKIQSSKSKLPSKKNPSAGMGETIKGLVLF